MCMEGLEMSVAPRILYTYKLDYIFQKPRLFNKKIVASFFPFRDTYTKHPISLLFTTHTGNKEDLWNIFGWYVIFLLSYRRSYIFLKFIIQQGSAAVPNTGFYMGSLGSVSWCFFRINFCFAVSSERPQVAYLKYEIYLTAVVK